MLACVACVLCSCTTQMKRANELIAEYTQKAEQANMELNVLADTVDLTTEEEAYVEAHAYSIAYHTVVQVAENWNLTTAPLEYEAIKRTVQAENLRVPLSGQKQVYSSKYDEIITYKLTAALLQRWVEIHS